MPNEHLKHEEDDLNIIDFIQFFLKNKLLAIVIIAVVVLLGNIYLYYKNSYLLNKALVNFAIPYSVSANLLIDPVIEDNKIFQDKEIIIMLNDKFASSFNYENWSNDNKSISSFLSQNTASTIQVLNKTHTISHIIDSKKSVEAFKSYLNYTVLGMSHKINKEIDMFINRKKRSKQNEINEITNTLNLLEIRREKINYSYDLETLDLQDKLVEAKMELTTAEDELEYINQQMDKNLKNTALTTLRILDLKNTVKVNKLIVQNLELKQKKQDELKNVINYEIGILDVGKKNLSTERELVKKEIEIELNKVKIPEISQLVSIGRFLSEPIIVKTSVMKTQIASIILGLMLSVLVLFFKREKL